MSRAVKALTEVGAPARLCIATGEQRDRESLVRFVLGPQLEVIADLDHELPGRGVWVTANRRAIAKAVSEQRFGKAFQRKCKAEMDLPERLEALMRLKARQYLALANKAGLVASGFEKTADALSMGKSRLLIEASDGSLDGHRKLRCRKPQDCEIITLFTSEELSLALGRPNVIHAAVAEGGLAEKLLGAVRRIEAFCAADEMDGQIETP